MSGDDVNVSSLTVNYKDTSLHYVELRGLLNHVSLLLISLSQAFDIMSKSHSARHRMELITHFAITGI
jgi:hypothetical protein